MNPGEAYSANNLAQCEYIRTNWLVKIEHREQLPNEIGQLFQAHRRIVRDILPEPSQMAGAINHQDPLGRRIDQRGDVPIDVDVAAVEIGEQVGARVLIRLREL